MLQTTRARLFWFLALTFLLVLGLQVSWSTAFRTASGPRTFAPHGDELRRDDGSVDYRATLERLWGEPPPPSENAVAVYLPLLCQGELQDPVLKAAYLRAVGVTEQEFADGRSFFQDWNNVLLSATGEDACYAPWPASGDQAYPQVAALLDRYRPELDRIREATCRKWHEPLISTEPELPLMETPMLVLAQTRHLMRILSANAFREAARGNLDAAVSDLAVINQLGLQVRGRFWMNNFLSRTITGHARNSAIHLLETYRLSESQLALLERSLQADGLTELMILAADREERYALLDFLQWVDRGKVLGQNSRFPQSVDSVGYFLKLGFCAFVDRGEVLRQVNRYMNSIGELRLLEDWQGSTLEAQLQLWEHRSNEIGRRGKHEWAAALISPNLRGQILGHMLVDFFHSGNFIPNMLVRNAQEVRLFKLSLAIERFQRSRGEYPERLEELVPEFIAELPADMFADSGTFGYEHLPAGFRVFASQQRPASLPSWSNVEFEILIQRPIDTTSENK